MQAIFIQYNQNFLIEKLWNSLSISKAYFGQTALDTEIDHEHTTVETRYLPLINFSSSLMNRIYWSIDSSYVQVKSGSNAV